MENSHLSFHLLLSSLHPKTIQNCHASAALPSWTLAGPPCGPGRWPLFFVQSFIHLIDDSFGLVSHFAKCKWMIAIGISTLPILGDALRTMHFLSPHVTSILSSHFITLCSSFTIPNLPLVPWWTIQCPASWYSWHMQLSDCFEFGERKERSRRNEKCEFSVAPQSWVSIIPMSRTNYFSHQIVLLMTKSEIWCHLIHCDFSGVTKKKGCPLKDAQDLCLRHSLSKSETLSVTPSVLMTEM